MPASTNLRRAIPWLLCLSAALWCASAAHAEKADRNLPLNAEADALRHDDARQTSIFTGNVVITKGTIIIRGDRVEVQQDAQGNQTAIVNGKPGFYRQKRDLVDEFIEGTGSRIDYDGKNDTVRFTGNAVLKRFKGTQLNDETTGNVIVYNNTTDVFTVDGGQANRTAANPTGRVRAMLTPVPKEGATPPPVPASPATLKPSPQLEETRP